MSPKSPKRPKRTPHAMRRDHEGRVFVYMGRAHYGLLYKPNTKDLAVAIPISMTHVMVEVEPGRWVATHQCVPHVGCQHCDAKPGQLCVGAVRPWTTAIHVDRARRYYVERSRP